MRQILPSGEFIRLSLYICAQELFGEKMSNSRRQWVVYTDGAAESTNPGPAAWGAVILIPEFDSEVDTPLLKNGFIGNTTNQVAELMGALEGLRSTPVAAQVELVSDSQYVLKGLTEWRTGWLRRGWRNAAGQPIANRTIWEVLYAAADEREVMTRWVKGHSGDRYNEMADRLAGEAIRTARRAGALSVQPGRGKSAR